MTIAVTQINGIGPKTAEFLKKNRITTVEALVKSGTKVLSQATGFNEERAAKFVAEGVKLLAAGPAKTTSRVKAKPATKVKSEKSDKKKDKKDKKGKKDKKDKKSKDKKGKKDKKNKKDKKKNKKNKK